jgi:hypothetical protein
MQQNSTYEELKKKVSQKNKMSSRMKEGIPGVASTAMEKPVLPDGGGKGSDITVRPKEDEDSTTKEVKTSKGISVQGVKTERPATAGPSASARPAEKTFNAPLRDDMGSSEKETRKDDKEKVVPEDRSGRMAQTPGLKAGQSDQETTTKDAEEIDPNKVFKWLLERRSDKK